MSLEAAAMHWCMAGTIYGMRSVWKFKDDKPTYTCSFALRTILTYMHKKLCTHVKIVLSANFVGFHL